MVDDFLKLRTILENIAQVGQNMKNSEGDPKKEDL